MRVMTGAEPTAALRLQEIRGASLSSPSPRVAALLARPTRRHLRTQCDKDQATLRGPLETLDPERSAAWAPMDPRRRKSEHLAHYGNYGPDKRIDAGSEAPQSARRSRTRETTIPLSRRDGNDRPAGACRVPTAPTFD